MSDSEAKREYPDLRIVPIGRVFPHELHDEQRALPLLNTLHRDGILKSPILVTTLDEGEGDTTYMILDGTNRSIALDLLGVGHALVQVVEYRVPAVQLLTWNHVISGLDEEDLQLRLSGMPGLLPRIMSYRKAVEAFDAGRIQAYCILASGKVLTLTGTHSSLAARSEYLQAIVASYIQIAKVDRVTTNSLTNLKVLYPKMAGVVVFPRFRHEEIIALVREGLRVPAGITRHLIDGRALRVNYPLEKLIAARPLEEKNRELLHWMSEKFARREVRYYQEATYVFDE